MFKQLYKRKMAVILKAAIVGVMSFSLWGCGEEPAQEQITEQAATVSEPSAESTAVAEVTEVAQTVSEAGFLDYDMVIGDKNAPIEMIEYASLTCNHCATFHTQVLPRIKEKYVDTGKVKIIMRSFLLNGVDAQATVLTRCVPESRYVTFMDALFTRQTSWYDVGEYQRLAAIHDQQTAGQMFVETVMTEVQKLARQVGMNKKKMDACFSNEAIGEYIFAVQQDGIDKYKINATPTIIVNGKVAGNTYASVEQAIEAELN
ncbi:MAG: DsbA family protein [Kordiimonadaceae bacterium]|jgi:protein-disulfide isomerase|nr:DsbA family protein [Kordiimonadaceae bacterium]MBT6031205.1 DsbA family protein [Kordiimonadaceae bacterium]